MFEGSYIGKTKADFVLRINSSAQNDILTYSDVYQYGTAWNDISSNVHLGVVTAGGVMPTISNELNVDGAYLEETDVGFVAGQTIPYDKNGIRCDYAGGENLNWLFSRIEMSLSDNAMAYYESSAANRKYARKAFIHEVGHSLKLAHPDYKAEHPGHDYSGRPIAIMNQGSPSDRFYVPLTVSDHDKSCLIAKWGK